MLVSNLNIVCIVSVLTINVFAKKKRMFQTYLGSYNSSPRYDSTYLSLVGSNLCIEV